MCGQFRDECLHAIVIDSETVNRNKPGMVLTCSHAIIINSSSLVPRPHLTRGLGTRLKQLISWHLGVNLYHVYEPDDYHGRNFDILDLFIDKYFALQASYTYTERIETVLLHGFQLLLNKPICVCAEKHQCFAKQFVMFTVTVIAGAHRAGVTVNSIARKFDRGDRIY